MSDSFENSSDRIGSASQDPVRGSDRPTPETSIIDEPTSVEVGGTVHSAIEVDGDTDDITLELTAGQTVMVTLSAFGEMGLPDSFLTVSGPGDFEIHDDDGGAGVNSLVTFTAGATGTYTIHTGAYPDSHLTGTYEVHVAEMTTDQVPDDDTSEVPAAAGATTYGFLESADDVDVYTITLEAGSLYTFEVAGGADYESDFEALPPGELDTHIAIYDGEGNLVAANDDIGFPFDISSATSFVVETGGTYYVEVSHSPLAVGEQVGGYTLNINSVDISGNPLDAIDWGSQLESNHVTVYFAGDGEEFDGVVSMGWEQFEIDAAMAAFQTWSAVSGLTFTITDEAEGSTFQLVTTTSEEFLGYFNPPGEVNAGVGVFAVNGTGWDDAGGLAPGGYGFITLVHEFGHGLGLAHPHDNGGTSAIMPGVTGPFGSFGAFDLNQGIYTTMSYNDGWQLHPDADGGFPPGFPTEWGYQAGPGAFDIAVIQEKYGASAHNTGNTVYELPDANEPGTFWSTIWDTGGTDTIVHNGSGSALIDLTAATLDYSPTGGGVISWVEGIFGGYTIAHGVVIENATGGSDGDLLIGNDVANKLDGRGGDDILDGGAGRDTLLGGDGNDLLWGGTGSDTLKGGDGNDYYFVDAAGDAITELSGQGYDAVESSVTYTLRANVEDLYLTGDNAINGIGNGGWNWIIGNDAANVLTGNGGEDHLYGEGGKDTLNGGADNDWLDGGGGKDLLIGGGGGDTLFGGAGADTLQGGADSDTLNGGLGKDVLNGGAYYDWFVFDAMGSANVDTVQGFQHGMDDIVLDTSVFTALDGGFDSSMFVASSTAKALDANDHVLYDIDNGKLYYDADGVGGAAAVQFAVLLGAPTLDADDILAFNFSPG